MRVLFMGTSEFAVPSLEELITHNFEIIAVVTQPDRPSGRGRKLRTSPIKVTALENNLNIFQPEKVRDPKFVRTLRQLSPDVIVVAAFGQLLPPSVLDIPPCGVINLHPSLLPKYRGAAPIQWTIINGEKETGITLMLLDEGEDTGDIICRQSIPIEINDTSETIHSTLANLGAKLLKETLDDVPKGKRPKSTPQDHAKASHAPRLTKSIGNINWEDDAEKIHNLVRGTAGWPGSYTYFRNDMLVKIVQSVHPTVDRLVNVSITDELPGTVTINDKRELYVVTGKGKLQLSKVQPATKRVMETVDFINGYSIKSGERFSRK